MGISIAAPVGPIGFICIRRTLADGRVAGFASGLGAATADVVYGSIAAFGLTLISETLVTQQVGLRLFGGVFLCYLGLRAFFAKPLETVTDGGGEGLLKAYVSTFLLTLTNPMTILSFAAIYVGLGLVENDRGWTQALMMVFGVFLGSGLWWGLLSGGVSLLRSRFTPASLVWVNRISGMVIFVFGIAALVSIV